MLRTHPLLLHCLAPSAVLTLLALTAGVPTAATAHLPVPRESFLNYHAANINELSQEVTVDPQVRERLAKHFHISESQMVTYIRRNLVLRHLDKTGVYRVACVRRDGSEYWINSRLPAGTPVFASRATGQPILKLACGNPMVSALPPTLIRNAPLAPPKIASLPVMLADSSVEAPPVLSAIDGTQSTLMTSDDLLAPPVVRVSPSIQLLGGGGSNLGSLFPALLGAGTAVSVFGRGGSSSNALPGTPSVPGTPAVPEASTVTSFGLLLLAGTVLFILRRKAPAQNL